VSVPGPPDHPPRPCRECLSAVGLTLLLVATPIAAAPQPQPQPQSQADTARYRVEPQEVDLGVLINGQKGHAEFSIHNDGTETLHVLRVNPG